MISILFLYSEIGPYTINWFEELESKGISVTVVYWDRDLLKPGLRVSQSPTINWIPRSILTSTSIELRNYKLVYCSGWMDKKYLELAYKFRKRDVPVVFGIDDMYTGAIKQRLLPLWGIVIRRYFFSHAWVAGYRQFEYARKMGYDYGNIKFNLLTTKQVNDITNEGKYRSFIYVGALRSVKGFDLLLNAYSKYRDHGGQWNLTVVGNDLEGFEERINYTEGIIWLGLKSNHDVFELMKQRCVFVMPGKHEQWGVSLHEAVSCSRPVLVSTMVGSVDHFLIDGFNGYLFEPNVDHLSQMLFRMENTSDKTLYEFERNSLVLARSISAETSVANLISIIQ